MTAVSTDDLATTLRDVGHAVQEPTWDFVVYCRFLARRVPDGGSIGPSDLARLAEEVIEDLKEGVDRSTGGTFDPPLLSRRADLLYDFFRKKLALVAEKLGGRNFAETFVAGLKPAAAASG